MRIRLRPLLVVAVLVVAAIGLYRCGDSDQPHQGATSTTTGQTTAVPAAPPQSPSTTPPGTSTTSQAPNSGPRFPAPFDTVDASDPVAVLAAVCRTMFSYQPGDATQADAARRAAPLLENPVDGSYEVLAPITGKQWRRWMTEGDRVVADAQVPAGNDNPDRSTSASRVITLTQHVLGSHGQPADDDISLTVYATATKSDDGMWRLSRISVQQ